MLPSLRNARRQGEYGTPGGRWRGRYSGAYTQVDQLAHVLVLPARASLIHRVTDGHVRIGIGEAQRPTGREVPEGARPRAELPLGHRELKAEPVARGPLQHENAGGLKGPCGLAVRALQFGRHTVVENPGRPPASNPVNDMLWSVMRQGSHRITPKSSLAGPAFQNIAGS